MSEADQMRTLAMWLDRVRLGLPDLLAPVADRHQPVVWYSESADSSRLRLRMGHMQRLERIQHSLGASASHLREAATVSDLKAALDAVAEGN